MRPDGGGVEAAAALGDGGVELGERGEMPIDDRLIHQRPEALGGLQLGAVGRQEHQADPLGDGQALGPVPAGVVEHEDDAAAAPRPGLPREGGEQRFEERLGEAGGEIPDRLAAGGLHKGGDVQPLVPVVAERDRPGADGRPNPAPDRLQADAALVLGPNLDRAGGMRRPGPRHRASELF